jgi:hypothetical protein
MIPLARVLYENHRNGAGQFGLHQFLCAMVDDALGVSGYWFTKNHVNGITRHGRDKLLEDCGELAEDMFADLAPRARFAIIDGDKVAEKIGLPVNAALSQIRAALRQRYPAVQILVPDASIPMQSNTEGLLRTLVHCMGWPPSDARLTTALTKSRHALTARDEIFYNALAINQRSARDRFREKQPTLAGLVDELAELVRPALAAE